MQNCLKKRKPNRTALNQYKKKERSPKKGAAPNLFKKHPLEPLAKGMAVLLFPYEEKWAKDFLGQDGGRLSASRGHPAEGEMKLYTGNPSVSLAADSSPYTGEPVV